MFGLGSLLADSSVTYQPAVVVDKSLGSERLHWAGDSGILILVVPPGIMPGAGKARVPCPWKKQTWSRLMYI